MVSSAQGKAPLTKSALSRKYTYIEKSEIYCRAWMLGMSSSATAGLYGFVAGFISGAGISYLIYRDEEQTAFSSRGAQIFTAVSAIGVAGVAAATTFFPAMSYGIKKGFEEGPIAVDPSCPHIIFPKLR